MTYIVYTAQHPVHGQRFDSFADAVAATEGWKTWRIKDAAGELLLECSWPSPHVRVGNTVAADLTI